jgi:hypothetical protein
MPSEIPSNTWGEYQRLVLAELERHSKGIENLQEQFSDLKAEIATRNELAILKAEVSEQKSELSVLKTKAAGWGALAGALAALVPLIMVLVFQMLIRGTPHP